MLILPIVNKNRILNVHVTLRGAEKVRTAVNIADIVESDVIVNGRPFSKSFFSDSRDPKTIVDFIRTNLVAQNRGYTITTKRAPNSEVCDVYEVDIPPAKVSDVFDELYGYAVLDMQKEIPGVLKSKYLSFEKIGLAEVFSDEAVSKVRKIVAGVYDQRYWMSMFKDEGLVPMLQILDLITMFDCTVVSGASIPEESMRGILSTFEKINSKDTKSLKKYYSMAMDNRDIYGKMSYVSKMVYGRPLNLIQSVSQRRTVQLVKSSEMELSQVA